MAVDKKIPAKRKTETDDKTVETKETEVKTETKEEVKKDTKKPAVKASFYVYIGPTIGGLITENAVFSANDKSIHNKIKLEPRIKHLLIADERLGEARAMLKSKDSYLANLYKNLANRA